jgi:enoyl-[acyl-carrier protein] reductase II
MFSDLAICKTLGIRYPIFQGGMAQLGTSELVSAVSNAGALGIIGSGNSSPEWLKDQIKLTRDKTAKPFAVNLMMLSPFLKENLAVIMEEKIRIVTFGGGNPGVYISSLKEAGVITIPVVSSVALARRLERSGADMVIAEGMESGGHIGETTTMALVPQVVDSVKIPVIAAGGIADGRGLAASLALGAQGVQLGTRFICTEECIAHFRFKQYIVQANDRATAVTGNTTGHPVRCMENRLTRKFAEMEKGGASPDKLDEYGRGRLFKGVIEGDTDEGSLMAGQIAGLIRDVKPVKNLIEDIMNQAERTIVDLHKLYGRELSVR